MGSSPSFHPWEILQPTMFLRGWDEGLPLCLFWDDFFFVKFADPVARPAEDLVCCPSASCVLEVFMPIVLPCWASTAGIREPYVPNSDTLLQPLLRACWEGRSAGYYPVECVLASAERGGFLGEEGSMPAAGPVKQDDSLVLSLWGRPSSSW